MQCFQQDPAPAGAPAGTLLQMAGCIPVVLNLILGGKGALLSAPAGASKRDTPTSYLTESTDYVLFMLVLQASKQPLGIARECPGISQSEHLLYQLQTQAI